jgi:putative nucleotidyltransferase with HDIG domain
MSLSKQAERLFPQPFIAICGAALAACLSLAAWTLTPLPVDAHQTVGVVLTIVLSMAVVVAYHFPIHLRVSSKVYMTGIVFFLMAVLLPLPFAITGAFLSTLAAEISTRAATGNYPSDIVSTCARAAVIVSSGCVVAHLSFSGQFAPALCIAAAAVMFATEFVTGPALLSPITGEGPYRVIVVTLKEGGLIEASQLLIGVLGVFAAQRQIWSLALLVLPTALVYHSFKRVKELDDGTRQMLESVADTVDLRDPYTGGHSRRVTEFVAGILKELGKEGPEVDLTMWAARVHDIGKIAVPDGILNKPGALTDEEREVMESHSEKGAEFLGRYPQFARGVEIVRHHHERWDGKGYPHQLKGLEIPFGSRIIAVADSFDAMTSDRPYRPGMSVERASAILREGRGIQWESSAVDALIRSVSTGSEKAASPARAIQQPERATVTA